MTRPMTRLRADRLERAETLLLAKLQPAIAAALAAPLPPVPGPLHAAVIRALRVDWIPIEAGAPGLQPMTPFGWGRPTRRIAAALGIRDDALLATTLAQAGMMIASLASGAATLAPGRYPVPSDLRDYFAEAGSGVDADGMFDFRAEHGTLLRHVNWRTDHFGEACWPLPYVDGKRPYGDCAYFQIDMAALLGRPYDVVDGEVQTDEARDDALEALHFEMLAALQVFLVHAALPTRP